LSGRVRPCQGRSRGFESRFPLHSFARRVTSPDPPFPFQGRRRQEVRQRSAKPPPPVQIRAAPPKSFEELNVCALVAQSRAPQMDPTGPKIAKRGVFLHSGKTRACSGLPSYRSRKEGGFQDLLQPRRMALRVLILT